VSGVCIQPPFFLQENNGRRAANTKRKTLDQKKRKEEKSVAMEIYQVFVVPVFWGGEEGEIKKILWLAERV